ncbi:MAG: GNAT family protein [Proteobacteria bacterium]|nr:GNAT family protein [Pseudomonadota bacterium]
MPVTIREITHNDIKIIRPWLIDKDNAKWLDHFFDNDTLRDEQIALFFFFKYKKIFLVLYKNIPVGIVGLNSIDHVNRSAELWSLLGERAYRKKGIIKSAQYQILKKAFYELHVHSITAWVVDGNVMKTGLEKLNFKTIGRQRECHLIDGVLKDRILFDMVKEDFDEIHRELSGLGT